MVLPLRLLKNAGIRGYASLGLSLKYEFKVFDIATWFEKRSAGKAGVSVVSCLMYDFGVFDVTTLD